MRSSSSFTLDLVIPNLSSRVTANQEKQKQAHDKGSKPRTFSVGDLVYVRDFPSAKSWLPGVIESVCGPVTFWIKLSDGRSFRRHVDHICSRSFPTPETESTTTSSWTDIPTPSDSAPPDPPMPLRCSTRISAPPDRYDPTAW